MTQHMDDDAFEAMMKAGPHQRLVEYEGDQWVATYDDKGQLDTMVRFTKAAAEPGLWETHPVELPPPVADGDLPF